MRLPVITFAFLCAAAQANGATFAGKVIQIVDGDTFVVRTDEITEHPRNVTVRLKAVDAPESSQPYYAQSRDNLAQLIADKIVTVEAKQDRNGATIGRVLFGDMDIGLEQIKVGLAWYQRADALNLSLQDQGYYLSEETSARRMKAGLWTLPSPTPPWTVAPSPKIQRPQKP